MDEVWFGQHAMPTDYETCLQALSIAHNQMPFFAIAEAGDTSEVILASGTLFGFFGASTGGALSTALLRGQDPGARRLRNICQTLPPEGTPRLERLRFFVGPGSEVLTLLCRRFVSDDRMLFAAAVLNMRSGSMVADAASPAALQSQPAAALNLGEPRRSEVQPSLAGPMSVQTIQAMLRTRWPTSRTLRFTWQTDATMICTQVTSTLGEIVGAANADIVGRDMLDVAAQIDPSGRFRSALARKETWSGLQVHWPIADAPAAVAVGLGAIPIFDREKGFDGFRGYGVVNRESAVACTPVCLAPSSNDETPRSKRGNLLAFPNGKRELSAEDQQAFVALGEELREEAGLDDQSVSPLELAGGDAPRLSDLAAISNPQSAQTDRAKGIARHGLAIFDRLAIGILISRGNVPIFANRHLLDSLGFRDEDSLHDAGGINHLFDARLEESPVDKSLRLHGSNGRVMSARARVQTIEWDGLPATLLTLHAAPDDSGALVSNEDIELSELRAILETATDGVAVIDENYVIRSLNRSGEALFGCDRSNVIGKPFISLFAPDNQSLVMNYLEGLASNPTKRLLNDGREFIVNAHPGGTIPVFMTLGRTSRPAVSEDKASARFCALFRDLTHWKEVERDLESAKHHAENANDRKSDFLAKVSHEIRTPLNAIIGFAEVMMDERLGAIGTERYKDYLRDIHASGTHVMSLVNDLLDLSKIEAGKLELSVEDIDVNKIIGECVAIMQPQASSSRVIMRLSLSTALPHVKADERSLRQIILNLLSNAVKFNEPGGQVIVATATTDTGNVVIRIRDTGPGMSETDIAAALEPFRQLPTARPNAGGTGLGLPLTKALVEANHATFTIRSKVQQGTLVEVAFPPARVLAA